MTEAAREPPTRPPTEHRRSNEKTQVRATDGDLAPKSSYRAPTDHRRHRRQKEKSQVRATDGSTDATDVPRPPTHTHTPKGGVSVVAQRSERRDQTQGQRASVPPEKEHPPPARHPAPSKPRGCFEQGPPPETRGTESRGGSIWGWGISGRSTLRPPPSMVLAGSPRGAWLWGPMLPS